MIRVISQNMDQKSKGDRSTGLAQTAGGLLPALLLLSASAASLLAPRRRSPLATICMHELSAS